MLHALLAATYIHKNAISSTIPKEVCELKVFQMPFFVKTGTFPFRYTHFTRKYKSFTNLKRVYLKSHNVKLHFCEMQEIFRQLCSLILFRFRNGNFTYDSYPSKREKSWTVSQNDLKVFLQKKEIPSSNKR